MARLFGDHLFEVFKTRNDSASCSNDGSQVSEEDLARANEIVSSILEKKHALETDGTDYSQPTKKLRLDDTHFRYKKTLPKIEVHSVGTVEACTHEVAVPSNFQYTTLQPPSDQPIKTFPFTLDPFQKEAILCLENNQSVLVSAHTSAGKTVVAEYAIAMSLQNNQRVIYTTPIKALSNQKFREFSNEFKDVGLMTGDVTINPTASCLVMTTEILRSMLYRGSEVTREVGWVIFDEIHYMRNVERGVVWEETIILLPSTVHFVFLSATIPNARQFAEWICCLHNKPCHVVYTDYRPVPLQHYIFPAGGDGLFLVVDDNGEFREDNFNKAMAVLQNTGDAVKSDSKKQKGGTKGDPNCFKIVKMIMDRNFAPVIVFSFSKKECEAYAVLMSKLDFNTDEEKSLVEEVFSNAMDILSEEDKKLPQVEHILPLLLRGIGIHHSGLLPILKETIEILFGEGLIKALFATETFAMGLNMPARTVLFTNPRKFDGKDFRWLSSGEYIQMSGRAGRRGIDDKGIIILMVAETMTADVGKSLVKGKADPLNSAFHLTYNMVLNLLRVEELNPEHILEKSFYQFQNYEAIPGLEEKVDQLKKKYDEIEIVREEDVASYQQLKLKHGELAKEFQSYLTNSKYIVQFLQPGRMVKVCSNGYEFDWGIVINLKKKTDTKSDFTIPSTNYIVDVLLHVTTDSNKINKNNIFKPCPPIEKGEMKVVPLLINLITKISAIRLPVPKDIRQYEDRMNTLKLIQKVEQRFPDGIPLLDPIEDMGINEEGFKNVINAIELVECSLISQPLHQSEDREKLCEEFERKTRVSKELKTATEALKKAQSLLQMDELKCRKRVLRRLGYCNAADVIEIKGKVACEIDSGEELLLTELLFSGVFNDLTVQQTVALLSCFVFKEKSNEQSKVSTELAKSYKQLQEMARHVATLNAQSRIDVNEDEYVKRFRPQLMDVVYAWSKKAKFAEICKLTDVHEGNIIRCIRSLDELLQQLAQAAKVMGNIDLEQKFCKGIEEIKRGIVFAVSLYL